MRTERPLQCAKTHMTPQELIRVLRVARDQRVRDWCMILVTYRHGLRTSEVCKLKLSDMKGGLLSINRMKGSLKTVQPLGQHPTEPLLDEVSALQMWLRERRNNGSHSLFTSRKGGALHITQFFRIFQSIAKQAGLPAYKRNPRILKYSLVAHLMERNVDVVLVNQLLGHRSINSTWKYVKRKTDEQAASAAQEAIAEIF